MKQSIANVLGSQASLDDELVSKILKTIESFLDQKTGEDDIPKESFLDQKTGEDDIPNEVKFDIAALNLKMPEGFEVINFSTVKDSSTNILIVRDYIHGANLILCTSEEKVISKELNGKINALVQDVIMPLAAKKNDTIFDNFESTFHCSHDIQFIGSGSVSDFILSLMLHKLVSYGAVVNSVIVESDKKEVLKAIEDCNSERVVGKISIGDLRKKTSNLRFQGANFTYINSQNASSEIILGDEYRSLAIDDSQKTNFLSKIKLFLEILSNLKMCTKKSHKKISAESNEYRAASKENEAPQKRISNLLKYNLVPVNQSAISREYPNQVVINVEDLINFDDNMRIESALKKIGEINQKNLMINNQEKIVIFKSQQNAEVLFCSQSALLINLKKTFNSKAANFIQHKLGHVESQIIR